MKKLKQLIYLILLVAATNGLTPKMNAMEELKIDKIASTEYLSHSRVIRALYVQISANELTKKLSALSQEQKQTLNDNVLEIVKNELDALCKLNHQESYNEILAKSKFIDELIKQLPKKEVQPGIFSKTLSSASSLFGLVTTAIKSIPKALNEYKQSNDAELEKLVQECKNKKEAIRKSHDQKKDALLNSFEIKSSEFEMFINDLFQWQAEKLISDEVYTTDQRADICKQIIQICTENATSKSRQNNEFNFTYTLELINQLFEKAYVQDNQKPHEQSKQITALFKKFITYFLGIKSTQSADAEDFYSKNYLAEIEQAITNMEKVKRKIEILQITADPERNAFLTKIDTQTMEEQEKSLKESLRKMANDNAQALQTKNTTARKEIRSFTDEYNKQYEEWKKTDQSVPFHVIISPVQKLAAKYKKNGTCAADISNSIFDSKLEREWKETMRHYSLENPLDRVD